MRRVVSAIALFSLLIGMVAGLSVPRAIAQEEISAATVLTDYTGNPLAEIHLEAFAQPFDGYASFSAPSAGFEYAALVVTIENVGERPVSPSISGFIVIDRSGFVTSASFSDVTAGAAPPRLSSSALEPGEHRTGTLLFEVVTGTEIAAVVYRHSSGRFVPLALDRELPVAGEAVELIGSEGGVIGAVTIEALNDPALDIDLSYEPRRGYHYVSAVITIENQSRRALRVEAYDFRLVDTDGYVMNGSTTYRGVGPEIENLPYTDLAPGETVTGVVTWEVYNQAEPAILFHSDDSSLINIIGRLGATPDVAAIAGLPGLSAEDEVEEEVDPQLAADCQELAAWFARFEARLNGLDGSDLPSDEEIESSTIEAIIGFLDQLEDARADQAADAPPEIGEAAQTAVLALWDLLIEGFNALADAREDGELLAPVAEAYEEVTQLALGAFLAELRVVDTLCSGLID